MRNTKKLLSVLLAGVMLVGMLPLAALAANDTTAEGWSDAESGAVEVVSEAGVTASAKVYTLAQDAKVYEITLTGKLAEAEAEAVTVGLPFTGSATYRSSVYQVGNDTGTYTATLPSGVTTASGTNSQKTYYAIAAGSSAVTFSVKAGNSYYNVTSSVAKADAAAAPKVTFTTADKNVSLPQQAEVEAVDGAASLQVTVADGYELKAVCSPTTAKAAVTQDAKDSTKWTVAVSGVTADTTVTLTAEQKTLAEVDVSGTVSNGNLSATVEIQGKIDPQADEVTINLTAQGSAAVTSVEATIPEAAVNTLKQANKPVTLGSESVGSIKLPASDVKKLEADVKLSIKPVTNSSWTGKTVKALDFSFLKGTAPVSFTNTTIELSVKVDVKQFTGNKVNVFYFDGTNYVRVNGAKLVNGVVTFTTSHLSTYVVMDDAAAKALNLPTQDITELTLDIKDSTAVKGGKEVVASAQTGNYVTFNVYGSNYSYYVTVKAVEGKASMGGKLAGCKVYAFVTADAPAVNDKGMLTNPVLGQSAVTTVK